MIPTVAKNTADKRILPAARDLFGERGIRQVTIIDIETRAEISEKTFQRYYKTKEEVIGQLIHQLMRDAQRGYAKIMEEDISFQYKVAKLIQFRMEQLKSFPPRFLDDIYEEKDACWKNIFDTYQKEMTNKFMQDLQEAQAKGAIRKDMKPQFLLFMLEDLERKILNPQLRKMYPSQADLIMELTNFFFYGILP